MATVAAPLHKQSLLCLPTSVMARHPKPARVRMSGPAPTSESPIKDSDPDKSSVPWLSQPPLLLLRLKLSQRPESAVRTWVVSSGRFVLVTHLVLDRASNCRSIWRSPCPQCGSRKPSVPHRVHFVKLTDLWLAPIGSGCPSLVGSRCRQNSRSSLPVKGGRRPLPIRDGGCKPTPRRACVRRSLLIQTVCSRRSPPRRATGNKRPWPACTPGP